MKTINFEKKNQRIMCSKKRKLLMETNKNAPFQLIKQIVKIKNFKNVKIIASFIPIKTEISTVPINNFIIQKNKKICLPVILNKNEHLIFRTFDNKTLLKKGKYGVSEPVETNEEVLPDMIFTPCLAFDNLSVNVH